MFKHAADLDVVANLVEKTYLFQYGSLRDRTLPEPASCAVCGAPEKGHSSRLWISNNPPGHSNTSGSAHGFISPTDDLRLARMKARRAE